MRIIAKPAVRRKLVRPHKGELKTYKNKRLHQRRRHTSKHLSRMAIKSG